MIKIVSLITFFILAFANIASAQSDGNECNDELRHIMAYDLNIKSIRPDNEKNNIVSESCKTWPYDNNLVLSAIAYDNGVEYEKNLVVATINKKTKHVVSSRQSVIDEDVLTRVGAGSLSLDTARYQLAHGIRAFGLRFQSSASGVSCGEAHWGDELTLLVPNGKNLRPILTMNMYYQKSVQGCISRHSDNAIWQDANITLAIKNTRNNGFYDLVATADITIDSNGASIDNVPIDATQHVFRYNGEFYQADRNAPWWLGNY